VLTEEIQLRLDLLLESEQISRQTFEVVKEKLAELVQQSYLDTNHESSGPFANHLAIAVERINKNDAMEVVTEQTEELIQEHPNLYGVATDILESCIWNEGAYYTKAEAGFITLYLAMFGRK
jgi:transcriptional regulatory protein LevR